MNRRLWIALWTSSAAALAVSVLPDPTTETVAAVPRDTVRGAASGLPGMAAPESMSAPRPALVARTPWPEIEPAASRAWAPVLPPPPAAAQPAPAAASAPAAPPPFPYAWIGQMEVEGRVQIYLSSPQRLAVAFVGDVLDTRWRIDAVMPGRLQVTWLPTDTPVAVAAR